MDISIKINDVLGIKRSDVLLRQGVTLIAGHNGSGKTSLLRVVAAVTCGETIPVWKDDGKPAVTKRKISMLLHNGSATGTATLSDGVEEMAISWPKGAFTGSLRVRTDLLTLGLLDWQLHANRQELLTTLLDNAGKKTEPTAEDYYKLACETHLAQQAFSIVERVGWDSAWEQTSKEWSSATGEWRAATGEAYGDKKAQTWRPSGWTKELETATEEGLLECVAMAIATHSNGVAHAAVDAAELARLRAISFQERPDVAALKAAQEKAKQAIADFDKGTNLKTEVAQNVPAWFPDVNKQLAVLVTDKLEVESKISAIDSGVIVTDGFCEICNSEGLLRPGKTPFRFNLTKPATNTADTSPAKKVGLIRSLKSIVAEIKGLEKRQSTETARSKKAMSEILQQASVERKILLKESRSASTAVLEGYQVNSEIEAANREVVRLEAKGTGVSQEEINVMRQEIDATRLRLQMWQSVTKAKGAAERVEELFKIRAILAPDGLRKTKLLEVMGWVNGGLKKICSIAGWENVTMDNSLLLEMGGVPYILLSKSEQWRAQAVVQVLFAAGKKSDLIAFDGADILVGKVRGGLIRMVKKILPNATAVITMSATEEYVEKVSSAFKAVFWAQDGVIERRKES